MLAYFLMLFMLCMLISISDIKNRIISNSMLMWLLALQMVYLGWSASNIVAMLILLVGGIIVFSLGWVGAGDVKYASILGLAVPVPMLETALMLTAFMGGMLVIYYYIKHKFTAGSNIKSVTLPYGVAISVGFYLVIFSDQFTKYP
ncbi:hypothetical protein BCU70_06810 [Vibrio sp. 10N.286.49.C2]|nr:hypothetical protein BCU70_06810 [Vibrio sp. 10N.286.49.C2]PMH50674.1 hypothetical protein BCU66_19170 [Vibrio sp. 10N.286.49.B1]PMH82823.1 hypothetical protein BCU58_16910 [Vibrio sp. 10N.286.48.B7]